MLGQPALYLFVASAVAGALGDNGCGMNLANLQQAANAHSKQIRS